MLQSGLLTLFCWTFVGHVQHGGWKTERTKRTDVYKSRNIRPLNKQVSLDHVGHVQHVQHFQQTSNNHG